jgi:hypothetical protein
VPPSNPKANSAATLHNRDNKTERQGAGKNWREKVARQHHGSKQ